MPNDVEHFTLPDMLLRLPWSRNINPHYEEVAAASAVWVESFNPLDPKAQLAFNSCNVGLLASLAYPLADKQRLRTCCDLMNLFFMIDDQLELMDEHGARVFAEMIMDALRNPHAPRPQGECVLGEMARQFSELAIQTAIPTSAHNFLNSFDSYIAAVVQQAKDREHSYIGAVDDYLLVRRETIGAKPSFAMLTLDLDIPNEVLNHPSVVELTKFACEMIILVNDMCSYNVEYGRGEVDHNMVTIVMHEFNINIQGAMEWIADLLDDIVDRFVEKVHQVPSWGVDIDGQLRKYIDGMGVWARANESWSFESERYFGKQGLEIQKDRKVALVAQISRKMDQ